MTMWSNRESSKGGGAKPSPRKSVGTLVFETAGRILYEAEVSSLESRPIVIGRDRSCDWCTAGIDNSVSSRHAEIVRRRGSVWIRDLGSRNGLFFQGARVKEHRFAVGDSVLLGACKATLEPPRAEESHGGAEFHRLEQRNGPEAGRIFELRGDDVIVIGSDPGCDIFVPDTLVSRRHAKLSLKKDGSCWISDLGSSNGTSVDGMAVSKEKERLLRDGNIVSVAYVEFRFLDRNAVHVNARIGAKLLVAAATVAVGIMGYSFWNLARRDAGWYLACARSAAERWSPASGAADFAPAFAMLDEAVVARQAEEYRSNLAEMRAEMESWTNTIVGWNQVRAMLSNGKWVSAQKRFHDLSSWTWNAESAPRARQEAETVQSLVNEFLAARIELRRTDWESGRERVAFARDEALLSGTLAAAPSTNDASRSYLVPIVGEATALRDEFRDTLARLGSIPASLAGLSPSDGAMPAPDAARTALARLGELERRDAAHAAARRAETSSTNFPWRSNVSYPFHAPIVAVRIGEAKDPLQDLATAEARFEKNVSAIAAGRWDDVENPLAFSSRELTDRHPETMRHRRWLEERNAALCGTPGRMDGIRGGFRSRLSNLEKSGFGPFLSSLPEAFEALRRPSHLAESLAFVDALPPLPRSDDPEPVCSYDRFVGAFELGDFVIDLVAETPPAEAAERYAAAWRDRAWRSELQQVRDGLVPLRSFRRWRDTDRTGLVRLVLSASPSSGPNRCAAALGAADRIVNDIADWCAEDLAEECSRAGTDRAAIFGGVVALLLADSDELKSESSEKRVRDVVSRWRALQTELKRVNRRAETDPVGAWREIVSRGFPANAAPFKGAWRQLRDRKGEK